MSGHKETGKKEGVDNSAEAPMGLTCQRAVKTSQCLR